MKWQVIPDTKKIRVKEGYTKKTGDDYAESYFTLKSYFCHADGDNYFEKLSPKQKQVVNSIVEFDEVVSLGGRTIVGLQCRLDSGQVIHIKLFKQDIEGILFTDLQFK